MARNTRQRIIEAAIRLFNERHFGNVTTAELAADLGITEGNLWYHFKSKRALLDVVSALYVERAKQRLKLGPGEGDILDSYAGFLRALSSEVRDFRFIFRDRADYGEHSGHMLANITGIYEGTFEQMTRFFLALREEGHLDVGEEWIGPLVTNAIVLIRFAHEFFREMNVPEADMGEVDWGIYQHLQAFGPLLKPAARRRLLANLGIADETPPFLPLGT